MTVKEIMKGIYTFPVVLPQLPLRELNVYVIKGADRSLVIDLGLGCEESYIDFAEGLSLLGIDQKDVDIYFTHQHIDHTGMLDYVRGQGAQVYITKTDADWVDLNSSYLGMADRLRMVLERGGVDVSLYTHDKLMEVYSNLPSASGIGDYNEVEEGTILSYGEYNLCCVEVPGHTRGHTALYEPNFKLLFSGDHVLDRITPNIAVTTNDFEFDTLGAYIDSLKKTLSMEIDLLCPGHGNMISKPQKRMVELINHHLLRKAEIIEAFTCVDNKFVTALDVVPKISWKVRDIREAPLRQQQFMLMETMAHLNNLVNEGLLKCKMLERVATYSI